MEVDANQDEVNEEEGNTQGNEEEDMDTNDGSHDEDTQMITIKPLPLTYQRGVRHVFAASKRKGTMSSTSTKKLDKGKQKIKE